MIISIARHRRAEQAPIITVFLIRSHVAVERMNKQNVEELRKKKPVVTNARNTQSNFTVTLKRYHNYQPSHLL